MTFLGQEVEKARTLDSGMQALTAGAVERCSDWHWSCPAALE